MITIVDYGMGNLASVYKALNKLDSNVAISSEKKDIENADKLLLPGVGSFANGMEQLQRRDLLDLINHKVLDQKTPIMGICLGMQLFANFSDCRHS